MKRRIVQSLLRYLAMALLLFLPLCAVLTVLLPRSYTAEQVLCITASERETPSPADVQTSLLITRLLDEVSQNQTAALNVIQAHGLPYTCEELLSRIEITHTENTVLLHVSATMDTPELAVTVAQEYSAQLLHLFAERFALKESRDVLSETAVHENNPFLRTVTLSVLCALAVAVLLAYRNHRVWIRRVLAGRPMPHFPGPLSEQRRLLYLRDHAKSLLLLFLIAALVLCGMFISLWPKRYEATILASVSLPDSESKTERRAYTESAFAHLEDPIFFPLFYESLPEELQTRYSQGKLERALAWESDTSFETGFLRVTCNLSSAQDSEALCRYFVDFFGTTVQSWHRNGAYEILSTPYAIEERAMLLPLLIALALAALITYVFYYVRYTIACKKYIVMPTLPPVQTKQTLPPPQ